MKKIICFGDSNTFGFNPKDGSRYDSKTRWTGVLNKLLEPEYYVAEEGCNNRTGFLLSPDGPLQTGQKYLPICIEKHKVFDIFIFALGTNDLQKIFNIQEDLIQQGLKNTIGFIRKHNPNSKIIIIAPVILNEKVLNGLFSHQFDETSIKNSIWIQKIYKQTAHEENCEFIDLNKFVITSERDGLHFNEDYHKIIAEKIAAQILKNESPQKIQAINKG